MTVTEKLLRPLLAQPARPLVTQYDETYGSRVELSVATVANWAAKTANWLRDEHDVEPGTCVAVRLPAHWQTAGVLLGAWWCGAWLTDDPAQADVTFGRQGDDVTATVALDPLGRGLTDPPTHGVDYLNEIRVYGDTFDPWQPVPGDTKALADSTIDELITAAHDRAETLGITRGARVLSTLDWTFPDGLLSGFLAVLAAEASLVQCDKVDADVLATRRATERTTVDLG
jgi:uncharacterized protein (TIGR03089 family)